jgi:RNA polymerase sigma-B factor
MSPTATEQLAKATKPGVYTNRQLDTLFGRWRSDEDPAARETLVRHFLPLARQLARRYAHTSEPYEDLVQVASLALLKALDRYDPARATSFKAFAIPTILGELRRHFRDCSWSLHVPRSAKERAMSVSSAIEQLTVHLGRAPTVQELAVYLELDIEDVLDGVYANNGYDTQPLDSPRRSDEDFESTLADTLGADDERYGQVDDELSVAPAIRSLPARERRIIELRYAREMTQSEIAARVGVSQMQVSRLLRHALATLQASF